MKNTVGIQYNLFLEEDVTEERFQHLKKRSFLFTLDYIKEKGLIGIFEDVCTYNNIIYYRCISFGNNLR